MALGGLIGDSPGLGALRTQVEQFLRRQSGPRRLPPVLILGETGTGKGLLARSIHDAGPRAAGPFVALNCAAIPETLLEAELFGFEQGAFTDARHAKAGLFQAAHRGTLFLDEIGLLPQSLQAKLLTVLEDRTVRRLGSIRSEPVDVWIVSATSEDLRPGARRRGFREELYHRLAVVTLRLPALRERGQDIVTLAEHFLTRTSSDYGLAPKTLTEDARAALLAYRWPGNVRELANLMERVTLLTDGHRVTADTLELGAPRSRPGSPLPDDAGQRHAAITLEHAVGEVERARILEALSETRWNISQAADRLGVTRNTLRYRLQKYRLQAPSGMAEPTAPLESVSLTEASTPGTTVARVQWERRHVALLRADLIPPSPIGAVSSTGALLENMIEKIATFGGQVEEVSPRGLLAAFGLEPVEDAPRRAAHAALAIQKVVAHDRDASAEHPGVRVGLHVGEVLVTRVSATARMDHEAKREAWQRLETLVASAEAGVVLLSEAARPFLERRFVLAPGETGSRTTEAVSRLVGLEQTGLGLGKQLTPFVGRSRELEQLTQALECAQAGSGQLVAVVGEAGVGKSRLLWEFVNSDRVRGSLILVTGAASYGKAISYFPVIDLMKRYFEIETRDDAETVKQRIREKVSSLEPGLVSAVPVLLALLDAPVDDARWRTLDPLQKRQRTLEAVRLVLLEESRRRPVILVFEDLHWIDSETQAVLDTLVESLPSHRILLLVSYRPEYQHTWGGKSSYAQLRLDPLPPESAHALLDNRVGRDLSTADLKAVLIERTRGNPFFLEESVRALIETGVLVGNLGACRLTRPVEKIQVPATIQAVLAARIDRLPPNDRALLETAAVIGREVPYALLLALADLSQESLSAGLARLRAAEFLHETRVVPEPEYAFKHALSHEVAYAGVFAERRLALHTRIMTAIEELYAPRLAEQVDRLAYHALEGEVWDKAVVYFRQAGAKAAARSAYREAVACFEGALTAHTHLSESRENIQLGIDLRLDLRNSLAPLGELPRIFEYLGEAEILAERIGDQGRIGRIAAFMAFHFWLSSDVDRAVEAGRRALAVALAQSDMPLRIVANLRLGQAYLGLGDFRRARDCFESNIESLDASGLNRERFGEAGLPSVLSRVWFLQALTEQGEFAKGIAEGEEGLRIAEAVDHAYSLIAACRSLGYLYLDKGDLREAVRLFERSYRLCETWDIPTWFFGISSFLGYAYVLSGRLADGLRLLERDIEQSAAIGHRNAYGRPTLYLSECYRLANRIEDATRLAHQALDFSGGHKRAVVQARALWALGEIAWHREQPDAEQAEAYYRQAMVLADELGMRPLAAHCHLGLGKLYRPVGRCHEASEHVATATRMYREMDMRFWLEQAEAEAARL